MLSIAFFKLMIVICISNQKRYMDHEEITAFSTGYFSVIRAKKSCPLEFYCFMEARNIHQAIEFLDVDFNYHLQRDLIEIFMELITAFKKDLYGC